MRPRRLLLLGSLSLLMPRGAFAECPIIPADIRAIAKYSALVFSGTVTKIDSISASRGAEAVTFEIERVWKGSPSKQIVVYNVTFTGIVDGAFVVQKGTKYIVFAHRQSTEERADFGLPASVERLVNEIDVEAELIPIVGNRAIKIVDEKLRDDSGNHFAIGNSSSLPSGSST